MTGALRVHGALSRGVFAVTVLISLAVLFTPGSDVPTAPPGIWWARSGETPCSSASAEDSMRATNPSSCTNPSWVSSRGARRPAE